jgi:hypothetical protein
MSVEIRQFAFTIPPATPIATPATLPINMPARVVTQIDIRVPPGPRGQVGFAIGSAGVPVIPTGNAQFIVADDQFIPWPLTDFWDSGAWQLFGYNLGQFAHTLYFTFHCDLVQTPGVVVTPLISSADLSSPSNAATDVPAVIGGVLVSVPAPTGVIDLSPAPTLDAVALPPAPGT